MKLIFFFKFGGFLIIKALRKLQPCDNCCLFFIPFPLTFDLMSETALKNYLFRMSCTLLPEYGGKELCMDAQVKYRE